MKRCSKCGIEKPLDDFYPNKGGRDGRRPDCKDCNLAIRAAKYRDNPRPYIERAQRWQRENPDRYKAKLREYAESGKKKLSDRKSHLKRKYGMTLEDFDLRLAGQGGGCAICGAENADNIDHHHTSGLVRGILCFRCNVAVGQLDEDPNRARLLAAYLDRHAHFDGLIWLRDLGLVLQPS